MEFEKLKKNSMGCEEGKEIIIISEGEHGDYESYRYGYFECPCLKLNDIKKQLESKKDEIYGMNDIAKVLGCEQIGLGAKKVIHRESDGDIIIEEGKKIIRIKRWSW